VRAGAHSISPWLFLAAWGNSALTIFAASILPDAGPVALDLRVLAFAFALSLLSATLFGLAPAFRLSGERLESSLKSGGRIAGDHRSVLRQSLAAAQIALALVLVVSTGLLAMIQRLIDHRRTRRLRADQGICD